MIKLQFEQRTNGLWVAELDGGTSYRIEMHPGPLRPDYDLRFVERRPDSWARGGWSPRYVRVSTHRSLERAIERANRHHRNRAKGA
ncbi:hypothetical protein [Tsukamurella hominis]|uniref:hypothetical protein n=1 Tax=Tsukamurella hominis TaxID=1970232 RepID=UPI0039E98543